MSWTTDELRELMAERSAELPPAPDRVAGAQALARRQDRKTVGAGVLAVALIITLGGISTRWLTDSHAGIEHPRPAATTAPSLPTIPDRLVHTSVVDGLVITTNGPADLPRRATRADETRLLAVAVKVTNKTSKPWSGVIGVALYSRGYGRSHVNDPGAGTPSAAPHQVRGLSSAFALSLPGRVHLEGVMSQEPQQIQPGRSTTFLIWMDLADMALAHPPVRGWVPVLNPGATTVSVAPLSGFARVHLT